MNGPGDSKKLEEGRGRKSGPEGLRSFEGGSKTGRRRPGALVGRLWKEQVFSALLTRNRPSSQSSAICVEAEVKRNQKEPGCCKEFYVENLIIKPQSRTLMVIIFQ